MAYFIDGRFLVNGKRSKLRLHNPKNLNTIVENIVNGLPSAGSGYTAGSGMTDDVAGSMIDLGGTLTKNANVNTGSFDFDIFGTNAGMAVSDSYDMSAYSLPPTTPTTGLLFNTATVNSMISIFDFGAGPYLTMFREEAGVQNVFTIDGSTVTMSSDDGTGATTIVSATNGFDLRKNNSGHEAQVRYDDVGKQLMLRMVDNLSGQKVEMHLIGDRGDGNPGIRFIDLPNHADNTAAGAAGLTAGILYSTPTGDLKIVY